jgi:SAM-dependent methyltransferase
MGLIQRLTRSSHIYGDVAAHFGRHLRSGKILDLPAGEGANSRSLAAAGYDVAAADLFPERCEGEGIRCDSVDMTKPLPYDDGCFDGVLHSEGIEHLDNQVAVLQELARVLRPGGVLIVTTPNLLHLEGRLSFLLTGHARSNRAMVVETAAYWGDSERRDDAVYFGHVFLINLFQLRVYLTHAGLEVVGVDTARYSWKSLLLAPLLWLPVRLATGRMVRHSTSRIPKDLQRRLIREVLSGPVLFGRKLIMIARKPAPGTPAG